MTSGDTLKNYNVTYIDINTDHQVIEDLLCKINFLEDGEKVLNVTSPGDGNMNVVLRVRTDKRSFIAKQSRPFVQKYKDIPAPAERIAVEYNFYKAVASEAVKGHIPKVLGYHQEQYLLLLEDVGDCQDLSILYKDRQVDASVLKTLVHLLSSIHKRSVAEDYPENKELRRLNHQHIFVLPFSADNGFSLDSVQEGLETLATPYKSDAHLKKIIAAVGDRYLAQGTVVLHGDYYPGSWMARDEEVFVIDPEFSFKGFAEFDLGVMTAHLLLVTGDLSVIQQVRDHYDQPIDEQLLQQIAGIETMRRLIGLAQLPLSRTLEEKERLLDMARELVMS